MRVIPIPNKNVRYYIIMFLYYYSILWDRNAFYYCRIQRVSKYHKICVVNVLMQ